MCTRFNHEKHFIIMTIITLTTDMGDRDYYVGTVKGALLCVNPALNVVDITHRIKPYNIVEASFVLGNSYRNFPEGSIHIISVNDFYQKERQFVAIKHEGHYFIGPDNGVFSLLFAPMPTEMYVIPCEESSTFPLNKVYAHAVAHLLSEKPFAEIGQKIEEPVERITLQPVTGKSQIRGSVIHIDHYDNVILNIKKDLFERIQSGREFSLFFKRYDPIKRLSEHYTDVPIGETLCLFNAADYLEIAINMGKASSMLGLNIDDTVQIDFT